MGTEHLEERLYDKYTHPDGYRQPDPRENMPQAAVGGQNSCYSPEAWLANLFQYHPPHHDQVLKYAAIRSAAKHLAEIIMANTPGCADQQAAIRKIREAVMTANAAIALDGRG